MEYIVPSIGRSGSKLIATQIAAACGKKLVIIRSLKDYDKPGVKKTHLHFRDEFSFPYRAVYMYSDIGSSIASLYSLAKQGKYRFLKDHFKNLEIDPDDIKEFFQRLKTESTNPDVENAFLYMTQGDKFRFMENMRSWRRSRHTLFLRYEDLMKNKDEMSKRISQHLGVQLPGFKPGKRKSRPEELPAVLREEISATYVAWSDLTGDRQEQGSG